MNDKMRLFDALLLSSEEHLKSRKDGVAATLLFDIYTMNKNNISKLFTKSALLIDPGVAEALLEQGLVQRITTEEGDRHALTFRGIANCVQLKFGVTPERQFATFLELSDEKFVTVQQSPFTWNEKLACLTLILMASTSAVSAIHLNNATNKNLLLEVFERVLPILKRIREVDSDEKLKLKARGEHPAAALMARLNDLARKTNHYYANLGHESGYFLDIEKDGAIADKRLWFLLSRVFSKYVAESNYEQAYSELAEVSQVYSPRFLARSLNPIAALDICKNLNEYLETGLQSNALMKTTQQS